MIIRRIEGAAYVVGGQLDDGRTAAAPITDEWDESSGGLPIRVERTEMGTCLTSAWYPTPEELKALLAGQPVLLSVFGTAHPRAHPRAHLRVEEAPVKLILPGRLS